MRIIMGVPSIEVMRPKLPSLKVVQPWLERMSETRTYSNFGPLSRIMEARFATFLNVSSDQVVSVANCTLGIQGAVHLSPAQKWLVPDYTFPATGLAVRNSRKELILADVDHQNWALSPESVASPPVGHGLLPVAPFGAPVDLQTWRNHEFVVIDAAASLGTQPDLGSLPTTWAVAFSLHATKVLPAGEGGIVVFGDAGMAKRFRSWTNFGFMGSRGSQMSGTNAKMSEIHAAYALASLEDWPHERDEWLAAQRAVAESQAGQALPHVRGGVITPSPYWIVDCGSRWTRELVEKELDAAGIGTRRWWSSGLHTMPAFQESGGGSSFPNTDALADRCLGLPMFRDIRPDQISTIAEFVSETLSASHNAI